MLGIEPAICQIISSAEMCHMINDNFPTANISLCFDWMKQLKKALTFSWPTTTAPLWCDELSSQFGKTGFEQTQVVSGGLVPLRPGHLQILNSVSSSF